MSRALRLLLSLSILCIARTTRSVAETVPKCRHQIYIEEDCTGGRLRRNFRPRVESAVEWRQKFGEYPALLLPYAELKDLELAKGVVGFNNSHAMLLLGMTAFFGLSSTPSLSLSLAQTRAVGPGPFIRINLAAARDLKVGDYLTVPGQEEPAKAPAVPREKDVCLDEAQAEVQWSSDIFGCDDYDHLVFDAEGHASSPFGFTQGQVIESSYAMMIDDAYFHEVGIDDYLWHVDGCCKLVSTGIVMTLAAVSSDPSKVNAQYKWTWQNSEGDEGLVTVVATKRIQPGEAIVLPSSSYHGKKHLAEQLAREFRKKPDFASSSCDFVIHRATYGTEEGLRVISSRQYAPGRVIERVPAATVEISSIQYGVINDYAFGFNSTHAVITFGIAMLLAHAEHKNTKTAFTTPPFLYGQLGTSDIDVLASERIAKDREIFNKYGTDTWFQERGVPYFPQDAKTGHVPFVEKSEGRFEGCTDQKHILVKDGKVRSSFRIEAGTILETARMLFAPRKDIQGQEARKLFWKLDEQVVAICTGRGNEKLWVSTYELVCRTNGFITNTIGLIMTFARTSTYDSECNVEYKWLNLDRGASMGVVVMVAKSNLRAFEEIVIPIEIPPEGETFSVPVMRFSSQYQQSPA